MKNKHLATASGKPRTMISTVCGIKVERRLATIVSTDVTCRYCAERGAQR